MNDQFEIGQLYDPARTVWPEGAKVTVKNGNIELLLFYNRPSSAEIAAIIQAECEFGVSAINDVIIFLFRFGTEITWSKQTFNYNNVDAEDRFEFELQRAQNARLFLNIKLIDAGNGRIKALRSVSLTPEFTDEFLQLSRKQLEKPFSITEYNEQLTEISEKYPNVHDFVSNCRVFSKKRFLS